MPVCVMGEGAGPDGQGTASLTVIPISHISTSSNHAHHSVKGTVVLKGRLVSSPSHNFILKAVLQDDTDSNTSPQDGSINVVLLGTLAKDFSQAVNQGDVVVASGFGVGKSPTALKDKLHPCNLLLSGERAFVHVCQAPPADRTSQQDVKRKRPLLPAEVPKYTYTKLDNLKPGEVVNVYGVVVFFKQPFKSRGSDFCSSLKITDQSQQKISCTIFCGKLESHPQIFQIGNIIRMHRVKVHLYNDTLTLLNTFGFSALTFDGAVGAGVEPRTASKSFHFTEEDRRAVEELRLWAASQVLLPADATLTLSAVQPKMYFDLTCQLLAKATVDTTCTLLRVWDGTRCPHALLKLTVEPNIVEGPTFSEEREKLIASVLVYDNHVQFAQQIKPGDFLRIYNLRAIPGLVKMPGLSSSQSEVNHLSFHLHGGTAYGRGIRLLPGDSPDVQELRRVMEAFQGYDEVSHPDLNDSVLWPPLSPERGASVACSTERTCDHLVEPLTLSKVKRSVPGGVHHVRVQLRSYEPRRLHQALKLYCSKCTSMQDVPDDEHLDSIFSKAAADCGPLQPCSPPTWTLSGKVYIPRELSRRPPVRTLNVHMSAQLLSEGRIKELIFLTGSTLQEACHLAAGYHNVVPMRSSGGHLALLDPPAPFLFRGRKRFYRCKQCSETSVREPTTDGVIDEKNIGEALGVQLLKFVLLMKFQLQDASDTLDVFLWRDAESFFNVSAVDAAAYQEAQDSIRQTLDSLCPPGDSSGRRPWLDVCLTEYRPTEEDTQTFYQICHTSTFKPSCTRTPPS
ncbi:protection of telomeres protein 1 isoform X2 [Dunckerocampus dactyliophorus]|uniref:protection of telomeres protein 1 isoform X2 n=1 Tax=Dunckerocampus dactyliophorus TaxID=161453 RepID=UPI002405977E|nr:protection of telomeres protein 1 isoform X2 [Dunckerocampus dactyliophorus]